MAAQPVGPESDSPQKNSPPLLTEATPSANSHEMTSRCAYGSSGTSPPARTEDMRGGVR
jgi:hypothetical protein